MITEATANRSNKSIDRSWGISGVGPPIPFLLKLSKARPSWTLPATPEPSTGPFHWTNRLLAPVEALRLQSFPRSWKLQGSYFSQVKQAGNATPPLLVEAVARSIGTQYFDYSYPKKPVLRIIMRRSLPTPEETKPAYLAVFTSIEDVTLLIQGKGTVQAR